MSRTIVIVGVTGTQGSSVAATFLELKDYHVRGVTRDSSSSKAQALSQKGVELVQADALDHKALCAAFDGASIIFANTAYPTDIAAEPGMQARASNDEYLLGKGIADAAATVRDLELFIWSSLSDASKWSRGQYRKVWHFDSKARVVEYINENLSDLAKKMSIVQMGLFVDNWKWGPISVPWFKTSDGSLALRIPGEGHEPVPFVNPRDAGKFVHTLSQLPTGTVLLAYGDRMTWEQYIGIWTECTGVKARLERTTVAEHSKLDGNTGFAEEMAEMYAYMVDYGYHGGDPAVLMSSEIQLSSSVTTLREYISGEDWTSLLSP